MEALAPEILELWRRVRALSKAGLLNQQSDLSVAWPAEDPELQAAFEAIPAEALAGAACALHGYGHWASGGGSGDSCKDAGAYWKFQKLADVVASRRGWNHIRWEKLHWGTTKKGLLKTCMVHKEGTSLDYDELAEKYAGLLPDPFVVVKVSDCNYKLGHPFVIGSQHFPKSSRQYTIDVHQAGCAAPRCGLSYEEHTYDTVLLVQLTRDVANQEAARILFAIKPEMEKDKLTGVGFLPGDGFKILPPEPRAEEGVFGGQGS